MNVQHQPYWEEGLCIRVDRGERGFKFHLPQDKTTGNTQPWVINKQKFGDKTKWKVAVSALFLTKEARIYNGEKKISLTSGAGKSGQPLVKEWN